MIANAKGTKRKALDGCIHLLECGDGWLQQLHERMMRDEGERDRQQLLVTYLSQDQCTQLDVRREHYVCLSCDYEGFREHPSEYDSFMTHSILHNHLFAWLPRKRQLYCSCCRDFVYPAPLIALTQSSTPRHSFEAGTTHLVKHRPPLRRRLLRSAARRGLVNMGNTCYMNAVLQVLAHNPLIQHEMFVLRSHNTTICEQRRKQLSSDSLDEGALVACCLSCELSSLLHTLFPAPRSALTSHQLTSPVVAQTLLESFWAFDPHFVGAHPHDAHEFLVSLLQGIHKHTFNSNEDPMNRQDTNSDVNSPRFTETGRSLCTCMIHQHFAGALKSEVICAFCKQVSGTHDPFMDLSLALENVQDENEEGSKTLSLDALLRAFTVEERLKGINQVYCRRCSRYVDATKRLVLATLPNLLVIHLKRLDVHQQRKRSDCVTFPINAFDLRPYCATSTSPTNATTKGPKNISKPPSRDVLYDLTALISHHGDSMDGGHFSAFVHHHSKYKEEEEWLHFDDCTVSSVSEETVAQSQAYILVYVRRRLFS